MRILNFKAFFLTDIFVLINFDENWILAGYFYYVFYSKIPRPNGHRGLLSLRESIFGREPVFRKLGASFQKLAPDFFENQPVLKIKEPVSKNWPFEKMETLGKCIFCHAIFSVMQRLRLKKSLVVYRNLRLKKSLVVYGILALQYFH